MPSPVLLYGFLLFDTGEMQFVIRLQRKNQKSAQNESFLLTEPRKKDKITP